MDSPHTRAATLMHAARRNHFAATIEKYEAKARQAKASSLKQRRLSLAPAEPSCSSSSKEHQKICVTESVVPASKVPTVSDHSGSASEHNTQANYSSDAQFNERDFDQSRLERKQRERDFTAHRVDSQKHIRDNAMPRHRVYADQKEIISGVLHMSSSSAMMDCRDGLDMTNYHVQNVFPIDMANSDVPLGSCERLDILPPLEVDIADIAAALNVRIKAADMSTHMQEHAFRCARESLNVYGKQQSRCIASTLKTEFDKAYGPAWHCIVGTSFGSYVTHSLGGFVYFYLDKVSILLFKTTVEPI